MRSYKTFLIVASIFIFNSIVIAETIELNDPADIQYAYELNRAMEGVSSKVMSCVEKGGTKEECMCSECSCKFTEEYNVFKKAYNDALAAHPDWEDEVIGFKLQDDPTRYYINFVALERQFSMQCE